MAIPTINIIDILPEFVKRHLFMILLLGDTAITTFFNFATGSNFGGIIGSLLGFLIGTLIGFATGLQINVLVATWQILFLTVLYQFGIFGFIYNMILSTFSASLKQ